MLSREHEMNRSVSFLCDIGILSKYFAQCEGIYYSFTISVKLETEFKPELGFGPIRNSAKLGGNLGTRTRARAEAQLTLTQVPQFGIL